MLLSLLLAFSILFAATKVIKRVPSIINSDNQLFDLSFDEFCYIVSMNRCNGSCSTTENQFVRICITNKIEKVKLNVFNMIKGINESKMLKKHIS